MLYSPLYQSIRLILFGALSLTSLSVHAAIVVDDSEGNVPVITDSLLAIDNSIDSVNDVNSIDDVDSIDDIDIDIPITAINDAAVPSPVSSMTTTGDIDSLDETRATRLSRSMATDPAIDNSQLNIEDASVQESLTRLADFYHVKPDTRTAVQPIATAQPITQLGTNLTLLPKTTIDSAPRCEGQWVYPERNANYQRAVNEVNASLNNGQTPPNLDNTPNNQAPLFIESDYGYYNNVNYAELSGKAVINQGSQQIEADSIVLDLMSGVAGAQGQVLFTDQAIAPEQSTPDNYQNSDNKSTGTGTVTGTEQAIQGGLIGVADSLAYSTESGQTTAYGVAFASVPLQAHGYAKRLNRPNESQYELDNVMFSTCPPTNRTWQFEAESIDLDTDTGRGEAYNTTFRVADVPVFYLPYFNFPIDSRRSSGFLLPSVGFDSDSGVEVDVPYYLNLAENYDATLNTHIYTNRNPMLSGEFRYLTDDYGTGIFNGSYLPSDNEYDNKNRSSFFYDHSWVSQSIPRLSGDATYKYVSDSGYLDDFDTLGLSDSTLNLPRRARLNYYNDYVAGELKAETYQTLDAFDSDGNPLEDKDKPYSRLPQLSLDYRLPTGNNFEITGVSDSAYFKKSINDGSEAEKSGIRLYNKISAAYPLEKSWGYIRPKVSLQYLYTSYDEDSLLDNSISAEDGSQSVFVPQTSIDAGLTFYQSGSPFGTFDDTMGGYQILSPRFKYTYSPYENQNDIPNFNSRIASINYEQLFSDSWFLGYDRLQDLHAFTPGINYRYIDATGVTRFDGSIAEQFYIDDGRVTLEGEQRLFNSSSSGMVWDSSIQPYNNVWVDVNGALTDTYDLNYITAELRYQPAANSLFNVGFLKRQSDQNTNQLPLSAVTASAIFPMNSHWRVLAQGQYDYRNSRMLDALVGVDYEDCCFGFSVYGRRYYSNLDTNDEPTQAIMAEIKLSGLGRGKGSLAQLLTDKVLGFEPVQAAWTE